MSDSLFSDERFKYDESVGGDRSRHALDMSAILAKSLHDQRMVLPLVSAMRAATGILAAMTARCERAAPPAEIEMTTDAVGDLIYRCKHSTPHVWKV